MGNYLALGWGIRACRQLPDNGLEPVPWACATHSGKVPNATEMNTYTVQMESLHYACENTIGKYRDDLSEFLTTGFKQNQKRAMKELARDACQKAAKCLERKPHETANARTKLAEKRLIDQDIQVDDFIRKAKKEIKDSKAGKQGKGQDKKKRKRGKKIEL